MAKPTEQSGESFMLKLARFIVDKRNLVFLVVIIGLIFSVFSRSWVQVENDLTVYLPADSETKPGARRHGRAVHHLRHGERHGRQHHARPRPPSSQDKLGGCRGRAERGITTRPTEHYNNVSALFSVTFAYDEDDERLSRRRSTRVKELARWLRSLCLHGPRQHAAGDHRPRDQRHHGLCRHRHRASCCSSPPRPTARCRC